jgi:PAS domain S-box-containing protein
MEDDNKTREQLLIELTELHSQNAVQGKSITGSISDELATGEARRYAESIVETVREPLLVLDEDLKVISANRNFYRTFKVTPKETIGSFIYDLGNKQWDIPKLRELLEEVLPEKEAFDDFEVTHDFQDIGHKIMLLNARQIHRKDIGAKTILLAIEDITEHKRLENLLIDSEEQYRRLFETASDGIVLLEKREGKITHANPATEKMLGYNVKESIGNKLSDIGVSSDIDDFQTIMQNLNKRGIVNYRNVKAESKSGQQIDTEVYLVDRAQLVQCNIRDITEHKRIKDEREKMLLWQQGVNLLQQSLLTPATLEEKLKAVTDSVVSLFNANFSRIWLIKPGDLCKQGCVHADVHEGPHMCRYRDRCLHLLASSGRYTHTDGAMHRRVPFGCYKIGRIASGDDHKFLTNDVQNDPRVHNNEWARELGLVSFVGYQIRVPGEKTLGVLALFAKHQILPAEDAILDGLSSTVARVVQRDITEKSLRDSEEKHRILFDSAGDAIFVFNMEAQTLAVNPLACERLGYTHAELMSMTIGQVDSPAETLNALDRMARLTEHGHLAFETVHQRKDGSLIPTDVIARRIDWGGQPAIMSICRDITQRKRAEEELKATFEKLRKSLAGTIQALSSTVETRDPYTAGHQRRVSYLACSIAQEMGLSSDTVDNIRMAGIIHDIGKISVPAEILSKPGRISDIEMSLIKVHSQSGYDILKDVGLPYPIAEMVLQHQERLDGSGYPKGLKGDQILLEAQIISVADVVEAISSIRPYRPALGIDAALQEIEKNKGILYNEKAVEVCIKLFREKGFAFESTES